MKKQTKNLLAFGLIAGWSWWYWYKSRDLKIAHRTRTAQVLPTDSMGPGTIVPAVQGVIKEGEGLSFIGV